MHAFSQCARVGLTVYPHSRTWELLAFDEYCRFDTSGLFILQSSKPSLALYGKTY